MSELCRHCGVTSRNACSTYKRKYLAEELSKCPNLDPERRLQEAAAVDGYSGPYAELLEYRRKFGRL